jgi:hypothetical protein
MPLYYFDLRDGDILIPDEEGVELTTFDAVQAVAVRSLTDIAKDNARAGDFACSLGFEVRDGIGPVLRAKFSLEIERL